MLTTPSWKGAQPCAQGWCPHLHPRRPAGRGLGRLCPELFYSRAFPAAVGTEDPPDTRWVQKILQTNASHRSFRIGVSRSLRWIGAPLPREGRAAGSTWVTRKLGRGAEGTGRCAEREERRRGGSQVRLPEAAGAARAGAARAHGASCTASGSPTSELPVTRPRCSNSAGFPCIQQNRVPVDARVWRRLTDR